MIRRPLLFMAVAFAAAIFISYYAGILVASAALVPGMVLALQWASQGTSSRTAAPCQQPGKDSPGISMRATAQRLPSGQTEISKARRRFVWILAACYCLSLLHFWSVDNHDYALQSLAEQSSAQKTESVAGQNNEQPLSVVGRVTERQIRRSSSGDEYVRMQVQAQGFLLGESNSVSDAAAGNTGSNSVSDAAAGNTGSNMEGEAADGDATGQMPEAMQSLKQPEKVLVSVYDNLDCEGVPGDIVLLRGKLKVPDGRRNPGCFDYRLYLKSLDIRTVMAAESVTVIGKERRLPGYIYSLKTRFVKHLKGRLGDETAAIMEAILFGDKGGLDEDTMETFRRNGTAHILAVSGLHIGIIYGFLLRIWSLIGAVTGGRLCGRRGWFFFVFTGAFFLCYMALASFAPSVVRAVIMVLLHLIAQLINRRYDLSNAAFLVFLLILADCPFMLFNAGFQMSFLAVLTMSLILPFVNHFYSGVLAAGVAVQLGLAPYMAYTFNYFSLTAVLVNIPVIFLAGIIVPLGVVELAISSVAESTAEGGSSGIAGLNELAMDGLDGLCRMLVWLNEVTEITGVTSFLVTSPPRWVLAAYYLIMLLLISEEGRLRILQIRTAKAAKYAKASADELEPDILKARLARITKTLLIIIVLSIAFAGLTSDGFDRTDVTFVDVGQGDCMHLRDGGHNYLIDGGGKADYSVGKKVLQPYLLKNGVRTIDMAIVTHLHTDHYDGIKALCQEGMVEKLCIYEGYKVMEDEILQECRLDEEDLIYVTAGDVLTQGEVSFTILAPSARNYAEYEDLAADEEDENKKSLLIKVEYQGVSVMMTGDIGAEGEETVLKDYRMAGCSDSSPAGSASNGRSEGANAWEPLQCDVLKVGHHGSKYSSSEAFLDAVHPRLAVIQVGKNTYGHPTPEVLQRLQNREILVYRNDLQGAIGLEMSHGAVKKVRTMIHDGQ